MSDTTIKVTREWILRTSRGEAFNAILEYKTAQSIILNALPRALADAWLEWYQDGQLTLEITFGEWLGLPMSSDEDDAAFIAAAPDLVRELIAEVKRLRETTVPKPPPNRSSGPLPNLTRLNATAYIDEDGNLHVFSEDDDDAS